MPHGRSVPYVDSVSIFEKFWSKVDTSPGHGPDGQCWIWTASTRKGYGALQLDGRAVGAHVVSYLMANGVSLIPDGKFVCHRCENPLCVRPSHLYLGSQSENMKQAGRSGRLSHSRKPVPDAEVVAMRKLFDDGASVAEIMRRFGRARSTVHNIVMRKQRKAVPTKADAA